MNYILKTIKRVICRFQRAYGSLQLSLDCPPTLLESFWINGHFQSRVRLHEKFFILTAAPLTCYNWKGNGEWRIVDSSLTCFRPCCTSTFTPRLRWQTRWVYNCGRCNTTLRTLIVRKADGGRGADLGHEFLFRIILAAETGGLGKAVQAFFVAGGVDSLMEGGGVILFNLWELFAQGEVDLVGRRAVVGAVLRLIEDAASAACAVL